MRKFVYDNSTFWFNAGREKQRKGELNEAIMAFEQVINGLEGIVMDAIKKGYASPYLNEEMVQKFLDDSR